MRSLYSLLAPAFHLEATGMRCTRPQAGGKEGRTSESIAAAELSPVHSAIAEGWLYCETEDSALMFPEMCVVNAPLCSFSLVVDCLSLRRHFMDSFYTYFDYFYF